MMQFKNLPVEIQEKMLDEQERQGNKRDAKVFEVASVAKNEKGTSV